MYRSDRANTGHYRRQDCRGGLEMLTLRGGYQVFADRETERRSLAVARWSPPSPAPALAPGCNAVQNVTFSLGNCCLRWYDPLQISDLRLNGAINMQSGKAMGSERRYYTRGSLFCSRAPAHARATPQALDPGKLASGTRQGKFPSRRPRW
jgi:hypothetical protein